MSSQRRILIDGTSLALQMKGVGRYTANTLFELSTFDETNQYKILVRKNEFLPSLPQNERFEYIPISLHNHYRHNWLTLPRMAQQLRADVAWIPSETAVGKMPCPYTLVCHDVPQFITASQALGGARYSRGRNVVAQIDSFFLRGAFQRAQIIFANSYFVGAWLHQGLKLSPEKIRYAACAPGADFATLSTNTNAESVCVNLDCPNGYLLAFATGDPRENVETILAVFNGLTETTKLNLVLAGTRARQADEIRARIHHEAWHTRVRVLPFFDETEMQQLADVYASAMVYLDLSLHEGFGMQVIEAMACGTPVVCSNRAALPEVAGDAAVLIDPMDRAAAIEQVRRILDEPVLRETLIARGKRQAAQFTWHRTAQVIHDALSVL